MRNQTSFRLTTTLLPTDTTAKTTQVINKVDSSGNKFYPTFTEETVVITNDDRTVMETTRATCTNGVLTFVKRGLSDDESETVVANRKLTWNPGSLCFITAGAGDWIDKDDDITWTGKQTYEDDMTSKGKATYKGRLITEKGVEYPHFDTLADLEDYASPFGGMFAVVDSNGELYRYNAVTENWSVVTTESPLYPEQATTSRIGTVRGATDAEFTAGTATGSNSELLVATPAQIQSLHNIDLHVTDLGTTYKVSKSLTSGDAQTATVEYTTTRPGWILLSWTYFYGDMNHSVISTMAADADSAPCVIYNNTYENYIEGGAYVVADFVPEMIVPVGKGTVKITARWVGYRNATAYLWFKKFFYYG